MLRAFFFFFKCIPTIKSKIMQNKEQSGLQVQQTHK